LRSDPLCHQQSSNGRWRSPCSTIIHFIAKPPGSRVFQNVYYDVGVIRIAALNFTQILAEAFEVGKFTKQLFSSDAFGLSELYYLGCILFRRALKRCLDRWLAEV
jgi:hypothetical protein